MIKRLDTRLMELAQASAVSSLKHCALVPEVGHALAAWIRATQRLPESGVLIGGLALSFYRRPRATLDVDILFLSDNDIPAAVEGFKRHRPKAFQERETHVEIETCTPASFHLPVEVARKVVETAHEYDGFKVASREGLIALKLYGALNPRRELQDLADVTAMCESATHRPDMTGWHLTPAQVALFDDCYRRSQL